MPHFKVLFSVFILAGGCLAQSRVTSARLRLVPPSYNGPCPGHVKLIAEITTDGPGTVWYQFLAGAVSSSPEGRLKFAGAGTQTVAIDGSFRSAPRVPHASLIAAMEDASGQHGPQTVGSGPVDYNIACGAPGQPAAPVGHLPEGTTVNAESNGGKPVPLKPAEELALLFVQDLMMMQRDACNSSLKRPCPIEEMLKGVKNWAGDVVSFKRDPRKETDYRYSVRIAGEAYEIEATPLKPGLGGFLYVRGGRYGIGDLFYNANGPATTSHQKVDSYGFSGDDFLTH